MSLEAFKVLTSSSTNVSSSRNTMTQLTWLVTGCSSGFGEAFVYEILSRGDRVIATGRNASERLKHLAEAGAAIMDLDVTAPQQELDSKTKAALEIYSRIDVLVNNAGYYELGTIEEISHERWVSQMNTNFFGPMNMVKAILPHFRHSKAGTLAFMSTVHVSRGALVSSPYIASKFALEGYVECLQKEVYASGIRCIIFEPTSFRTKLLSSSKLQSTATTHDEYKEFFSVIQDAIQKKSGKVMGDPRKGAEQMVDVIKGQGMAQGRTLPFRLPLGSESLQAVKEKCFDILRTCNEWEELITSTDLDPSFSPTDTHQAGDGSSGGRVGSAPTNK